MKQKINLNVYKSYNELVFVSKDNLKEFDNQYNINIEKQIIYNYIDSQNIIDLSKEKVDFEFSKEKTNILTISRLVDQKAIDRLARIHNRLKKDGFSYNQYIIGDGPERENLENLIKELDISDTFKLLGSKQNPYPYLKNCDYFALLSNYEGYPMTLLEAKILNKNILITDTAAREVVSDYKNVEIFRNNEDDIYSGMKELLSKNILKSADKENYEYKDDFEKIENLLS